MLWIPITLAAAALQTARNAFQRGLTGALSPLGATYTRFAFGFPFAALYAACVFASTGVPAPGIAFFAWVTLGGVAQILGTAVADAAVPAAQLLDRDRVLEVGDPPGGARRHSRARRRRVDARGARDRRRDGRPRAALARSPAPRAARRRHGPVRAVCVVRAGHRRGIRGRGGRVPRRVALARRSVVPGLGRRHARRGDADPVGADDLSICAGASRGRSASCCGCGGARSCPASSEPRRRRAGSRR